MTRVISFEKNMDKLILLSLLIGFCGILADEFDDAFRPDNPASSFHFGAKVASEKDEVVEDAKLLELKDIVIIVRSQHNSYHARKANDLTNELVKQAESLNIKDQLHVRMIHEDWAPFGSWTIFPMIKKLSKNHGKDKSWVFFCEEDTVIDLLGLVKVLGMFNPDKELFLGHALQDQKPAIIHHFAFFEDPSQFSFPDFASGWAISRALLNKAVHRLSNSELKGDFSIDVQHEVAMFFYDNGKGVRLTDVPELCTTEPSDDDKCVTNFRNIPPSCGDLDIEDIFIAVKTTLKFHKDRVPIVMQTMAKHAKHIILYSNLTDPSIPTQDIGVPNTEKGHCAKLYAIIEQAEKNKDVADKPWVVVADDDTIMSVPRLQQLLACYDPKEPILLGERYGYAVNAGYGYEYITGGGSMVLSRAGVKAVLEGQCRCWTDDSPDDMWLGSCFKRLGIPTTHSYAFHQAQPGEYVSELLAHQTPLSFHKHYDMDPMKIYRDYLS